MVRSHYRPPDISPKNQSECSVSCVDASASNSLNEPRTVPTCLASLGKRRAKRSYKVLKGSRSSARASAPSSPQSNKAIEFATKLPNVGYRQTVVSTIEAKLIGAVGTHAATSSIAHAENVTAAQCVEGGRSISFPVPTTVTRSQGVRLTRGGPRNARAARRHCPS